MHKLIAPVGRNDADILPFFIDHHRSLGIGEFHLFLRGSWGEDDLAPIRAGDVVVAGSLDLDAGDYETAPVLEAYARAFAGDWLVLAEPDEFLELPYETLDETVAALTEMGIEELPANVVQRAAPDGRLAPLTGEASPGEVFSSYDFRLAERMHVAEPTGKNKYPLARVGPEFRLWGSPYLPHTGRASAYLPVRGVVHRYAWRDRLLNPLGWSHLSVAEQERRTAYRKWLRAHGLRVPVEGLKPYSRQAVLEAGHLHHPTAAQLRTFASLAQSNRVRWRPTRQQAKVRRALQAMPPAAEQVDERASSYLERRWLLTPPGRIALVTFELQGMHRTGGIGTAMAALAERLVGAGHEVHIFYCPFSGPARLEQRWIDLWKARGVEIHYLPIGGGQGGHVGPGGFLLSLCHALRPGDWDVIHFQETCGFAAGVLLLRAAGLAFQDTQVVITAHGPTRWHRRGNSLPWSDHEAAYAQFEAISVALADIVVSPSAYMVDWLRKHLPSPVPHAVIPNSLTGESRRFGRISTEKRTVRRIVFFGRIEFRKGIDVFADAIDHVLASGIDDFEVVFLGRAEGSIVDQLAARIAHWNCKTQHLTDYASHEAIDLLRAEGCLAVLPSRVDNLPYTVYECLENGVPFLAPEIGGIPELIRDEDRARVLVKGGAEEYAAKIIDALTLGVAPARPRFDPTLADIDLLALHGRLVNDARLSRGKAELPRAEQTVVAHGADPLDLEGPLAQLLWRWAQDGVETVAAADLSSEGARTDLALESSPTAVQGGGAALNRLAESASGDHLLFCHTSVVPREEALTAMVTALEAARADAVVCGYESLGAKGEARTIPVFAGPPELTVAENVYGARVFLVRKDVFLEAGGFNEELGLAEIAEWEFLNRLNASGHRIVAIPAPMAWAPAAPPPALTDFGRSRLAAPWIEAAPAHLQSFLAMGLLPARPASTSVPSAAPLGALQGVAVGDASRPAERIGGRMASAGAEVSPSHTGRDGGLLDASLTYFIDAPDDAEGCDFLVADDLLTRDHGRALVKAFRNVRHVLADGKQPTGHGYLWLNEMLPLEPAAGEIVSDAVARAIALAKHFHGIDFPIYPTRVRILEVDAGGFVPPPSGALKAAGEAEPLLFSFAGAISLNDDLAGGESYLPALDIAVRPKRGRLIVAVADSQHDLAVLRVDSGSHLMLRFDATTMPDGTSGDALLPSKACDDRLSSRRGA